MFGSRAAGSSRAVRIIVIPFLIAITGCGPFGGGGGGGSNQPPTPTLPGSTGPTAPTTTVVQPAMSVLITQATTAAVSGYVAGATPLADPASAPTSATTAPIFVDLMAIGPSVISTTSSGLTTTTTGAPNPLPLLSTVASTATTAVGVPPGVPAFVFDLTQVSPDRAGEVAPGRTVSVTARRADGTSASSAPVLIGGQ